MAISLLANALGKGKVYTAINVINPRIKVVLLSSRVRFSLLAPVFKRFPFLRQKKKSWPSIFEISRFALANKVPETLLEKYIRVISRKNGNCIGKVAFEVTRCKAFL